MSWPTRQYSSIRESSLHRAKDRQKRLQQRLLKSRVSHRCSCIMAVCTMSTRTVRLASCTRNLMLILFIACEDMDPVLIAAASVNISGGGGGQYVTNVHLEPYADLRDFHDTLYPSYRNALFSSAARFFQKTDAKPEESLVFVSAGFDACEHEYPTMSRHGAKVPMSFYTRFARDVSAFANERSQGRLVAVLEGGYSLRALSTGVGHFCGLACSSKRMYQADRPISDWTCR